MDVPGDRAGCGAGAGQQLSGTRGCDGTDDMRELPVHAGLGVGWRWRGAACNGVFTAAGQLGSRAKTCSGGWIVWCAGVGAADTGGTFLFSSLVVVLDSRALAGTGGGVPMSDRARIPCSGGCCGGGPAGWFGGWVASGLEVGSTLLGCSGWGRALFFAGGGLIRVPVWVLQAGGEERCVWVGAGCCRGRADWCVVVIVFAWGGWLSFVRCCLPAMWGPAILGVPLSWLRGGASLPLPDCINMPVGLGTVSGL